MENRGVDGEAFIPCGEKRGRVGWRSRMCSGRGLIGCDRKTCGLRLRLPRTRCRRGSSRSRKMGAAQCGDETRVCSRSGGTFKTQISRPHCCRRPAKAGSFRCRRAREPQGACRAQAAVACKQAPTRSARGRDRVASRAPAPRCDAKKHSGNDPLGGCEFSAHAACAASRSQSACRSSQKRSLVPSAGTRRTAQCSTPQADDDWIKAS